MTPLFYTCLQLQWRDRLLDSLDNWLLWPQGSYAKCGARDWEGSQCGFATSDDLWKQPLLGWKASSACQRFGGYEDLGVSWDTPRKRKGLQSKVWWYERWLPCQTRCEHWFNWLDEYAVMHTYLTNAAKSVCLMSPSLFNLSIKWKDVNWRSEVPRPCSSSFAQHASKCSQSSGRKNRRREWDDWDSERSAWTRILYTGYGRRPPQRLDIQCTRSAGRPIAGPKYLGISSNSSWGMERMPTETLWMSWGTFVVEVDLKRLLDCPDIRSFSDSSPACFGDTDIIGNECEYSVALVLMSVIWFSFCRHIIIFWENTYRVLKQRV